MQAHLEFLRHVFEEVLDVRGFEIQGPFRESGFLTGSEILQKSHLLEPGSNKSNFLLLILNLRSFLSNARPPGKIPMKGRSGWGRWMSNGGLGGSLFVGAVEL